MLHAKEPSRFRPRLSVGALSQRAQQLHVLLMRLGEWAWMRVTTVSPPMAAATYDFTV